MRDCYKQHQLVLLKLTKLLRLSLHFELFNTKDTDVTFVLIRISLLGGNITIFETGKT